MTQEKSMGSLDHIFIVGHGRTGSTLTRQILNSSDCVGIGGESHYLIDSTSLGLQARPSMRKQLARVGDLTTDEGARKVVDHLFTLRERRFIFWNFAAKNVEREDFLRRLLAIPPAQRERGLFALAMDVHAAGKPVRGEKTPAHIFFVPELLEWFPNAKIIHTFRDPRAIYSSRKKKAESEGRRPGKAGLRRLGVAFQLVSSLHVIANWRRIESCHRRYQEQFRAHYTLLKYEDLVLQPEDTLEKLCRFLDVPLTQTMLLQTVVNSSFVPDGAAGFEAGAITRWRKHMDPLVQRWFKFWLGPQLRDYGYEA
jgi:hypothetical protein